MTTLTSATVAFERILVPTDFSDASERAIEYAKSIASQFQSQLLLAHINQPLNPVTPPDAIWMDTEGIREQLEQQLEQRGAALRSEGFRAKALSVTGSIRKEILSLVSENKIDLIVMGTHGRSGVDRILFGSDTEAIFRKVSCPVLVVGPQVAAFGGQVWHPKRVICATTLEPDLAWVPAYAYRLSVRYQAEFILFNIGNPGPTIVDSDWLLFEATFKKNLGGLGSDVSLRTLLSDNPAGQKIVDVAKNHCADLIVMAARTASPVATHLPPGTVPQVLIEAPCPVMTLH